ncbi:MAG: hypothetical protein ACFFB5_15090 [Promethearchaeota archaeon]
MELAKIFLCSNIIILLSISIVFVEGVQSEWSPVIKVKSYHWKALKSELHNLKTNEQYNEPTLIGGINTLGGDNKISLRSKPPLDFNFLNGSRLDIFVVIEGDMVISPPKNSSDFHLLILPIKFDSINFFQLLFDEKNLLENLTHSTYINSTITETIATTNLKFNQILDVKYEWNTTTGILARKIATSPSGLQLVIMPGIGWQYGTTKSSTTTTIEELISGQSFSIGFLAIFTTLYIRLKKK